MALIIYEKSPKPQLMLLSHRPLSIWLTRHAEVRVERNDKLITIARHVVLYWTHLKLSEARELVALWFAIGERRGGYRPTNQTWTHEELDASPERRYCGKHLKRISPRRRQRRDPDEV